MGSFRLINLPASALFSLAPSAQTPSVRLKFSLGLAYA
jgi:hypothetical protein